MTDPRIRIRKETAIKNYDFTAKVSDGKHHDGEFLGYVRANSEAEARQAIAEKVREDGIRKTNRPWTAFDIQFT